MLGGSDQNLSGQIGSQILKSPSVQSALGSVASSVASATFKVDLGTPKEDPTKDPVKWFQGEDSFSAPAPGGGSSGGGAVAMNIPAQINVASPVVRYILSLLD